MFISAMVNYPLLTTLVFLLTGVCYGSHDSAFRADRPRDATKRDSVAAGYVAAPYYPAPPGGWVAEWADSYAKAQLVVENMTLAEKVNLTTGTGYFMGPCAGNTGSALRFGIPSLCLSDSALGVARTDNITAFPAGITVGATFSKSLMYSRGLALGAEARGKGVNIQLGPTVGPLGRKPRGGRNWEGFGADPVLQGKGAALTVQGMQANGVIATVKHFVGNEQEEARMRSIPAGLYPALSSNIDDRTLHELYAWPFAEAIRAGVGAVMTSYNDVNGSAASQNSQLISGLLKDEMGFQGLVMTDWLAQIGGVSSALSGLDMAMPGDGSIPELGEAYWAFELSTSILNGTVPLDRLNDMVTRIVATWYQLGQDKDYPPINFSVNTDEPTGLCYPGALVSPTCTTNEYVDVQGDHASIARQIAREGITLLKNDNATLPLSRSAALKVFGTDAENNPDGINSCTDRDCDTGVLGMGWGSGTANYPYLDAPIDAIKRQASNVVYYASDTFPSSNLPAASPDDIALVFINSDSGEQSHTVEGNVGDRSASGLSAWHDGDALVAAAAEHYATVVVVAHTVGPILVESWIDLPAVRAVLFAHLPGQEAGDSLADVLFGDHAPSGHLPYSIPTSESSYPASVGLVTRSPLDAGAGQIQDTFSEGLYVDYRYLNRHGVAARYPFGHGLSYTTFAYSDAAVAAAAPLAEWPPARPPKGPVPAYSTAVPPAAEVAWPRRFARVWRYLYPYLDDPAAAAQNSTGGYDYPAGYSTAPHAAPAAGGAQGGNAALWEVAYAVNVTVTNTGVAAGKAVAMLFVQFPPTAADDGTPVVQLRDFAKTEAAELAPGESTVLVLSVTRKDLSVWDVAAQNWRVAVGAGGDGVGDYLFWVGGSSAGLDLACEARSGVCSGGRMPPV